MQELEKHQKVTVSNRLKIVAGLLLYVPFLVMVDIPLSYIREAAPGLPFVSELTNLFGILLGTFIMVRFWDRRTMTEFGFAMTDKIPRLIGLGILISAGLMTLIFSTYFLTGLAKVLHIGWSSQPTIIKGVSLSRSSSQPLEALSVFIMLIGAAITEEVITRGYILQNIERGFNTVSALIISSVLFGISHIITTTFSGANLLFGFNVCLAGALFGYVYLITRTLWFPIALHFAWNYFQGPVFGFAISGAHHPPELLQVATTGPDIVAGGAWGPEGGLVVTVILIVSLAISLIFFRPAYPRATGE